MSAPTDIPTVTPTAPITHVEKCMGTVFSFRIEASVARRADLFGVRAWLHDMDALFSTYRADSQVSAINAGRLAVGDADPEVREVLAACERQRELTDGYFDAHPDGRRLDPSGYVKGWAVQRASEMLAAAGSTDHCVNGGGDVQCLGRPEPGRGWSIGITDPHRPGRLLRMVTAPGPIAVATSGLAERGAHILDPHTGRPATELASVTVVARDLVTADVHATAAVAMGTVRARRWLAAQPGVLAVLVTADGDVVEVADAPGSSVERGQTGARPV